MLYHIDMFSPSHVAKTKTGCTLSLLINRDQVKAYQNTASSFWNMQKLAGQYYQYIIKWSKLNACVMKDDHAA